MGKNRIPDSMPEQPGKPAKKFVVVQTPAGVIKIALPEGADTDGDPVAVAMNTFQTFVDRGAEDPLAETLNELQQMASKGESQPLQVGLAILKQMSESGMLPPMSLILQGTGMSVGEAEQAIDGAGPSNKPSVFDKLDQTNDSDELLN